MSATSHPAMSAASLADLKNLVFTNACFIEYANSLPSVVEGEQVICGPDGTGGTATMCSGGSRQDTVGTLCRKMCSANSNNAALCTEYAKRYCSSYGSNPDCSCLMPTSTSSWGTGENAVTWTDVTRLMANNDLQGVKPRCLWPPCTTKGVLPDSQLKAPNVCPSASNVTCVVSGNSISLSNVTANSLKLLTQKCGSGGASSSGSSSATKSNMHAAWSSWNTLTKVLVGAGGLVALLIVVGVIALIVTIKHRTQTEMKLVTQIATQAATAGSSVRRPPVKTKTAPAPAGGAKK